MYDSIVGVRLIQFLGTFVWDDSADEIVPAKGFEVREESLLKVAPFQDRK